jgi:hypothetical protein
MADQKTRVEAAFRQTVESEMTRANAKIGAMADGVPFSRGLVFSKTNPFSRGIVFSRSGAVMERPEEEAFVKDILLDEPAMKAFAERVAVVRQVKDAKTQK